jgi:hypothetical protein
MPCRKLWDAERWQAIGLIKTGITHRRVGENLNCIKIKLLTSDFYIAFALMSLDLLRFKNKNLIYA